MDKLHDALIRNLEDRWRDAYLNQGRGEQSRRLGWVIKLAAEYERQQQVGVVFASAFARGAIASVFDGDWKLAETEAGLLEEPGCEAWRPFVAHLRQCLAERPGEPS